jgi:hypothetical protein
MPRTFASGQRLSKASALLSVMPLSFSAWINVSSLATSNGVICICNNGGSAGWFMYTDTSGGVLAEQISSGDVFATTTAKVTTGSWFHLAAVYTSTTSRSAYLNGANKVSNATSGLAPSGINSTYIGSVYQGAFFDCTGSIAFAGIWNVALADAEVAELGAGISPLGVRPSALKAYAPLCSAASPELDLVSSTGWTLTGAPPATAAPPKIILPY